MFPRSNRHLLQSKGLHLRSFSLRAAVSTECADESTAATTKPATATAAESTTTPHPAEPAATAKF